MREEKMNLYQYGEEFDSHILAVTQLLESGLDPDSEEVQTALKYMVNAEAKEDNIRNQQDSQ